MTDEQLIAELESRGWVVPELHLREGVRVKTKKKLFSSTPYEWGNYAHLEPGRRADTFGVVDSVAIPEYGAHRYRIRYEDGVVGYFRLEELILVRTKADLSGE